MSKKKKETDIKGYISKKSDGFKVYIDELHNLAQGENVAHMAKIKALELLLKLGGISDKPTVDFEAVADIATALAELENRVKERKKNENGFGLGK